MKLAAALFAIGLVAPGAHATECAALTQFVIAGEYPEDATCSTSRVLGGGQSIDCYWTFAFRVDAARQEFSDLSELLRLCADGEVTSEGASVNHPDSYDQLTTQIAGRDVSLSLKDKGALNQTLIFLRAATVPPE